MKKLKSHTGTIPRRAPNARSAVVDRLSALRRHVVNDVMRTVLFGCESLVASSSHVPRVPVFDSSHFDWVSKLESNVAHIQKEGLNVLSLGSSIPAFHEVSPDQERISQDERWRTFFLFGMGYGTPFAEELCPETVAILKSIP